MVPFRDNTIKHANKAFPPRVAGSTLKRPRSFGSCPVPAEKTGCGDTTPSAVLSGGPRKERVDIPIVTLNVEGNRSAGVFFYPNAKRSSCNPEGFGHKGVFPAKAYVSDLCAFWVTAGSNSLAHTCYTRIECPALPLNGHR